MEALKRKNNPMMMDRDHWSRMAHSSEQRFKQFREDTTRQAAMNKAEKEELRAQIQDLETRLASVAAPTEYGGAFGNIANRRAHNSENLQATQESPTKLKNTIKS